MTPFPSKHSYKVLDDKNLTYRESESFAEIGLLNYRWKDMDLLWNRKPNAENCIYVTLKSYGRQIFLAEIFLNIKPIDALEFENYLKSEQEDKNIIGIVFGVLPDHICESIDMMKKGILAFGIIRKCDEVPKVETRRFRFF